jgi:hypothetical protein
MMANKKPNERRQTITSLTDDLLAQVTNPTPPAASPPPAAVPASADKPTLARSSPPPAPEPPTPDPTTPKPKTASNTKPGAKKKKLVPDEDLSPYLQRERKRIRERQPNRATFDLTPKMRQKIADLAEKYGCPQSQLVALLLVHGIKAIFAGEIDPAALYTPSGSPKFAHNLDLAAALADLDKLP